MPAIKIRRILLAALFAPLAAVAAIVAIPTARHMLSAVVNDPERLLTIADRRVHFDAGARDCAEAIASALDAAIARVETAHGRPFAAPPTVAAYVDDAAYAAANGLGATFPAGVTFRGRVAISPAVCGADRARLPRVLAHELSHAHLQQRLSPLAYVALPPWFVEGLAVSASGGGGAETVSPDEARAAMTAGRRIAVGDSSVIFNLVGVRYEHPRDTDGRTPVDNARMAYRQAGMFVDWLREQPEAFAAVLNALLDGGAFADAFDSAYHARPSQLWRDYLATLQR